MVMVMDHQWWWWWRRSRFFEKFTFVTHHWAPSSVCQGIGRWLWWWWWWCFLLLIMVMVMVLLTIKWFKTCTKTKWKFPQMFLNRQSAEISLNCPTNFAGGSQCCYNIETQTTKFQNILRLLNLQCSTYLEAIILLLLKIFGLLQYFNIENDNICCSKYYNISYSAVLVLDSRKGQHSAPH